MNEINPDKYLNILERIACALEHQAGKAPAPRYDFKTNKEKAFIWDAGGKTLIPVADTRALPLKMLIGIDDQKESLLANTAQFAKGFAANNALLWGARGMGKSSIVKAVHAHLSASHPLILIEIHREDIASLSSLLHIIAQEKDKRFLLYCDDLSFDEQDSGYKSLKAVLEGGIQARPDNVIFYATSNRRHLMPRNMIENEARTAIHGGETIEEKVSLSDRFGLWLGFYPCDQDHFFTMIETYADTFGLDGSKDDLRAQAIEWSMQRGGRSGRVAWQFIQNLAGKQGKAL
tara:strand:- start:1201 stop:2070 length:870 start_codon:yes stop_codon:yes gene_type:complete